MSHEARAERRKAIYSDSQKGMSIPELAAKYGLTIQTIFQAIKEIGGVKPMKVSRSVVRVLTILKMIMDGGTNTEISEKLGISRQRVSEVRCDAREVGLL